MACFKVCHALITIKNLHWNKREKSAKLKIKEVVSQFFTTSNCSKVGQLNVIIKQIAKFILTSQKCQKIFGLGF